MEPREGLLGDKSCRWYGEGPGISLAEDRKYWELCFWPREQEVQRALGGCF